MLRKKLSNTENETRIIIKKGKRKKEKTADKIRKEN